MSDESSVAPKIISARFRPDVLELLDAWRRLLSRQAGSKVSYAHILSSALRHLPLPSVPDASHPDYNFVLAVRSAHRKIWKDR